MIDFHNIYVSIIFKIPVVFIGFFIGYGVTSLIMNVGC